MQEENMVYKCILCGSDSLEVLKTTKQKVYVTGDRKSFNVGNRNFEKVICKSCGTVQFLQNADHKNAVEEVFRNYDVMHMKSWSINIDGRKCYKPQLEVEYERIRAAMRLPRMGRMIDIGCGGGEALFQFHRICPEWELYGMDIGEQFREAVIEREGVKNFFASLEEVRRSGLQFDFISINHMLCLADNPVQILESVYDVLTEDGIFFIMDTDYEVHPCLLCDIENSCFFTNDHMRNVISAFGFEILDIAYEHEKKDIVVFSKKSNDQQKVFFDLYQTNKKIYEQQIDFLNNSIDIIREYVTKNKHIGIFGTSIAGVWLSEIITKGDMACDRKDIFYIEEDEEILRRETGVNGYPICRLEEIAEEAIIFLPFPRYIAESIKRRCMQEFSNCEFIVL